MSRFILALVAIALLCLLLAVSAPMHPYPPLLLIAVAALAVGALVALSMRASRHQLRRLLTVVLLMLGIAPLAACANPSNVALLQQMDKNFAACDRHITFQGGVGVITPGAQVSGSVDCKGQAASAAAAPGAAAP